MNQPVDDLFVEAELHGDLVPYLVDYGRLGRCLKHPLVFGVPYHEMMNNMYNKSYEAKLKMLDQTLDEKRFGSYVFIHERPHRFEALANISESLSNKEYWKLLGEVWVDSENIWQQEEMGYIPDLILSDRPDRHLLMDEEEQEFMQSLPDEVILYRGHDEKNQCGYSWTFSYFKARWFAKRFNPGNLGKVSVTTCRREEILAVFLGRGEFEAVIIPQRKNIKLFRTSRRPKWLGSVWRMSEQNYALNVGSHHGPTHWQKVERNVEAIAKVNQADPIVCRLFAVLHDCKREHEHDDPEHGQRAANYAKELFGLKQLPITEDQLNSLMYACRHHTEGRLSDHPTIGACWDADRMDLIRVGTTPDTRMFSTQAAKELLWRT